MSTRKAKLTLFAALTACSLGGCSKNSNPVDPNVYTLSYEKTDAGYYIKAQKYNHVFSTIDGSLGVRFKKNDFRTYNPQYGCYESVTEVEGGLLATGSLTGEKGTVISFRDYFKALSDRVTVNREFEVTTAGKETGFMVEQKWTDNEEGKIHEKEWFVPASYYVNGTHTFNSSSNRMYFGGNTVTIPSDSVSALLASSYKNNFSFTMMDTASGYRETTIDDIYTAEEAYLYTNENFNFAGIQLNNESSNKVSFNYLYPSYSNRKADNYVYRLLPIEKGLKRTISYALFFNQYANYNEMYTSTWRKAYSAYKYADKRYNLVDVYNTLINRVRNSYSASNMWGDIPQYMTDCDHYFPDSGFLYRNIEMATFMLRKGVETSDAQTIANALVVINYALDTDSIDATMRAYQRDNSVFNRVLFDGLASAVDLYEFLETSEYENNALKTKLYNYIATKAELYKNETSLMAISFYSRLYKLQNVLFLDYSSTALRLANEIKTKTKEYSGYYGAIENTDQNLSAAEDYMIFLRGMMNLYEAKFDQQFLDESIRLGNYLETFNVLTPIMMNPIGATGNEGYNCGFIGNERFLGYGYSYNNTNHGILDCPTASTVIEYLKLYQYTNDAHYLEFAESKFYNALLYVNMGDKVGDMDDPLHSSGDGYINEFAGNATTKQGYSDGGIRGAVHNSLIGWNIYELLYGFEYLRSINYKDFAVDADLSHNLAKNKVIRVSKDNLYHSVYGMTDDSDETYYISNEASTPVIDLYEQCNIKNIKITSNSRLNVQISSDNETFVDVNNLDEINAKARYVKINVPANEKVSGVEINGSPVKYVNLAATASVVGGDAQKANAIDKSNYMSAWNAGSSASTHEMTIDLGTKSEIYETSVMFDQINKYRFTIEISNDGVNFESYASEGGSQKKYVFVNQRFAKARYVRLTVLGSDASDINIKDFKVLGSC